MKTTKDNKTFKYKGWKCKWVKSENMFYLYSPGELKATARFRCVVSREETAEMCKKFIDNY
jgi:hypothetical protein